MTRPRWHDVLIVVAIVGVGLVGVWALWWDDVRRLWDGPGSGAGSGSQVEPSLNTSPT
jgi:hypothetical protein